MEVAQTNSWTFFWPHFSQGQERETIVREKQEERGKEKRDIERREREERKERKER